MVWESRNVCDAAKQQRLNEFEMQLGQRLPKCADVYPTSKGLIAIGTGTDENKMLIFEPNQKGTVDVYDTKRNANERVLAKKIDLAGFKKVRGLLLSAQEFINQPKMRAHDPLTNEDNKTRRIERFVSERSPDNSTKIEGRRHYGATAILKQSGNCRNDQEVQRAVHASLVRLCKGAEYSGYLYLIESGWDKAVCREGRYDTTVKAGCLDYTITVTNNCATPTISYSKSCPTISSKKSCPTISSKKSCPTSTNKTSCPTAENKTNCPTRK